MYTGLKGALKILNTFGDQFKIAYISGWSLEDKTKMIETNKIGKTYKQTIPGFQSWSASANGVVVFEKFNGQEFAHERLFKAKHRGEQFRLQLFLNDESLTGVNGKDTYFEGDCYIESLSVDLSAEDKGNISISVSGSGMLDLFVEGKNTRTNNLNQDAYFRTDEHGNLFLFLDERCSIRFRLEDGHLKISKTKAG